MHGLLPAPLSCSTASARALCCGTYHVHVTFQFHPRSVRRLQHCSAETKKEWLTWWLLIVLVVVREWVRYKLHLTAKKEDRLASPRTLKTVLKCDIDQLSWLMRTCRAMFDYDIFQDNIACGLYYTAGHWRWRSRME